MTVFTDAQAPLNGDVTMTGHPYPRVVSVEGLAVPPHDHITLDPPSQPTTITYRQGGASGTVVAVLTLTYSGADVATVARAA